MARKILFALFSAHLLILLVAFHAAGFKWGENLLTPALFLLNLLGIAGIATRTRVGWFAALVFVAAAVAHYTFHLGVQDASGLFMLLGIGGAVLCVTDPVLRREHGIVA